MAEGYMSVTEAAKTMGISVTALYDRIRAGTVQAERIGARMLLVPTSEVEKWRDRGKLKAWEGRRLRERQAASDSADPFEVERPGAERPER